jgi:hypothetical protein
VVGAFVHPTCNSRQGVDGRFLSGYLVGVESAQLDFVRRETCVVCRSPPCTCQSPGGFCASWVRSCLQPLGTCITLTCMTGETITITKEHYDALLTVVDAALALEDHHTAMQTAFSGDIPVSDYRAMIRERVSLRNRLSEALEDVR